MKIAAERKLILYTHELIPNVVGFGTTLSWLSTVRLGPDYLTPGGSSILRACKISSQIPSINCHTSNILSVVDRPVLKPHTYSPMIHSPFGVPRASRSGNQVVSLTPQLLKPVVVIVGSNEDAAPILVGNRPPPTSMGLVPKTINLSLATGVQSAPRKSEAWN